MSRLILILFLFSGPFFNLACGGSGNITHHNLSSGEEPFTDANQNNQGGSGSGVTTTTSLTTATPTRGLRKGKLRGGRAVPTNCQDDGDCIEAEAEEEVTIPCDTMAHNFQWCYFCLNDPNKNCENPTTYP